MSEQEQASSAPEPTHARAPEQAPAPAETDAPADNAADAAPAEAEHTEKPEQPKRDGIKERLGELTRQRREAERERDLYRQMLERQMAAQPPQVQAQQAPAEQAPDPSKFAGGEYDPAYQDALVTYRAEQTLNKKLRELSEQQRRAQAEFEARRREMTFAEREAAVEAELPEYREITLKAAQIINQGNPMVVYAVKDALAALENGPEVYAHLGQNESVARRIKNMVHPADAVVEIGRIAERLKVQREAAASRQTKAPDPPPTVRTRGPAAPTLESAKTFAEFERIRMREMEGRT